WGWPAPSGSAPGEGSPCGEASPCNWLGHPRTVDVMARWGIAPGVSKGDTMNGSSIQRRAARGMRGTAAIPGRALLSVRPGLATVAGLVVAASAGTSPAAAATTRTGLSAVAARASHPGETGQARIGRAALLGAGQLAGSWRKLPAAPAGKPATQALTVWTGSKMIVYGIRVQPGMIRRFNVAYLPASGTWQQLARGPRPD